MRFTQVCSRWRGWLWNPPGSPVWNRQGVFSNEAGLGSLAGLHGEGERGETSGSEWSR